MNAERRSLVLPLPLPGGGSQTAQPVAIEARMADYYVRRAATYERVYLKPERQADLRAMEAWLSTQFIGRSVLEIACGTGWWTPHGAAQAKQWLATDLNPETFAFAQAKLMPASVEFRSLDAYTFDTLRPDEAFDAAFAGCWWSHIPLQRLPGWLSQLHARLAPGSRVAMLDNSYVQTSSTPISRHDAEGNAYQQRPLDDGSSHEVLKNFPTPDEAIAALGPGVYDAQWRGYEHYWVLSYLTA